MDLKRANGKNTESLGKLAFIFLLTLAITRHFRSAMDIKDIHNKRTVQWPVEEAKLFDVWKEAMAQLRHTQNTVWVAMTFFVTVSGVCIAVMGTLYSRVTSENTIVTLAVLFGISLAGFFTTAGARIAFRRHREHFVHMLAIKAILDEKLGFTSCKPTKHPDWNLTFEWKIEDYEALKANPQKWEKDYIFGIGTVSRALLRFYDGYLIVFVLLSLINYTWLIVEIVRHYSV